MINTDSVRRLAKLSKIDFTDSELLKIAHDITEIISLTDAVRDFNNALPPHTVTAAKYTALRKDSFDASNTAEEITSNAKVVKNNCFVVPKTI